MGLDVGLKRIGIAMSDLLGFTAQAYEVWPCQGMDKDIRHIVDLCEKEGVREIVVGYPLRTDGTAGPEAKYIEQFQQALQQALPDIPVHLWDERFSTHEAQRSLIEQGVRRKRRREIVDMAAAAVILQSFMERRRRI